MRPLLGALRIGRRAAEEDAVELCRGELEAARAGLEALGRTPADELPSPEAAAALQREYQERLRAAEAGLHAAEPRRSSALAEDELRRRPIVVEKDALLRAYRRGAIDGRTRDKLLRERDERLVAGEREGEE